MSNDYIGYSIVVDGNFYSYERDISLEELLFRLECKDFAEDLYDHSVRIFRHIGKQERGEHILVSKRKSMTFEPEGHKR